MNTPAAVTLLTSEMADSMLRRDAGMNHPDSQFTEAQSRAIRAIASGAAVVVPAASVSGPQKVKE